MPEVIAGLEIPETAAVAEATRLIQETTNPFTYHHSRRVFFFGLIHAHKLGVKPDPELLYLAAMFHDIGLLTPFSDVEQRFELDGADHARKFLLDGLEHDQLDEIIAVHPRGDFRNEYLRAIVAGLKNRPETANFTLNSDVLEHFIPGFQRTTTVEAMLGSPWPS